MLKYKYTHINTLKRFTFFSNENYVARVGARNYPRVYETELGSGLDSKASRHQLSASRPPTSDVRRLSSSSLLAPPNPCSAREVSCPLCHEQGELQPVPTSAFSRDRELLLPRSCSIYRASSSDPEPERKFPHPGCGATFPSPSLRSPRFIRSFKIARRAGGSCAVPSCPLTDAVNGQLAQQQLLCLQFSVPRAGTKGSALAPHATPGSGPLASASGVRFRFLPLSAPPPPPLALRRCG